MNYYDAMQIRLRHAQGQPVSQDALDEARAYVQTHRRAQREEKPDAPPDVVRHFAAQVVPPMDVLCKCGRRYGMHRVNDYARPNPHWKPGNGQAQWLGETFRRPE